jgi:hypothetical protein
MTPPRPERRLALDIGLFGAEQDRHVLGLGDGAATDVNFFYQDEALFDHGDLFDDRDHGDIALDPHAGERRERHVARHAAHLDLVVGKLDGDRLLPLADRDADAQAPGLDLPL